MDYDYDYDSLGDWIVPLLMVVIFFLGKAHTISSYETQ
jgi:hypothetical protein